MSYCRFLPYDAYIYMDFNGTLTCCGCALDDNWQYESTQEMVDHIAEHRVAGHHLPDDIEQRLWEDDEENFPPQCSDGHDWGEPYQPYPEKHPTLLRKKCSRCDWEGFGV